ncbi:exodeoxyribonuclease V subunit alpha [Comamonas antarctica]|uniref:RecBCD enzyme subunit RecD n=1 Tax=Comamonas antarctica TaxID=2743470 RepID=A0A6N1X8B8_9BURK|nr:exodeoxyribonuclease V subunit alpha [Comamonas antarctica]QKV54553.1 exodeoxyribonuclease V subunit alpha [Comamonas antarctica]
MRPVDDLTLDLFADLAPRAPEAVPATAAEVLDILRGWSEQGLLRHLDTAMARFVAAQDPEAAPALLVATALLVQMEGRGHSCLPLALLVADPNAVLAWPAEAQEELHALWSRLPRPLARWQQALARSPLLRVAAHAPDQGQPLVLGGPAHAPLLYLRRYWDYERQVAAQITQRSMAVVPVEAAEVKQWLDRMFAPTPEAFDWQRLACAIALRGRFSVITGGPGTGKTYTVARLLALLFATAPEPERLRVALAAPTGKAAARLKQSIDASLKQLDSSLGGLLDLEALVQRVGAARTLHSLLGARPDTRAFAFHHGQPLDVDVLIVDEASMIHLEMMAALLDALPPAARVVFLGDKDQLASVEAGAVLGDLCRSAEAGHYTSATAAYALAAAGQPLPAACLADAGSALPLAQQTVMLRESRRFGGPIGQLAQAVNTGDSARALALLRAAEGGVLHMREGAPPQAVCQLAVARGQAAVNYQAFVQALAARPALTMAAEAHTAWVRSVLTAFERFRLLCAVREGDWGVAGLNRAIEKALAEQGAIAPRGEWYAGRPVMVTRNDAALGVYNGDIGVALPGAMAGSGLRVYFMDGPALRAVGVSRLAHVETAFAMTVHKSQGSEFEHTALVLSAHAGSVLGRELVYTGITRARQAFTLMSQAPGLLASAIHSPTQRVSGLLGFLEQQAGQAREAPGSAAPDELAPWVD